LNGSDIESLRSENDELKKNVEVLYEALRELQKDQRKLEDEEAEIRKTKVSYISMLFTSLYSSKAQLFLIMLIFWSSYLQEVIIDRMRSCKKRREEIKRHVGMVLFPSSSTCSFHNIVHLSSY
jgi:hypothetical protein